jgi:hypothetical protein
MGRQVVSQYVLRPPTGGVSWNDVNAGLPSEAGEEAIAISPADADTLYLGTAAYSTTQGFLREPGETYRSTDGGTT